MAATRVQMVTAVVMKRIINCLKSSVTGDVVVCPQPESTFHSKKRKNFGKCAFDPVNACKHTTSNKTTHKKFSNEPLVKILDENLSSTAPDTQNRYTIVLQA